MSSFFKNLLLVIIGIVIVVIAPHVTTKDSFEGLNILGWIMVIIGGLRIWNDE